ncbi:ribosome biogenesis GTPase YlqF [bacterium]|nr:ribosome biogenesis GTPase YlqF [bacterium]
MTTPFKSRRKKNTEAASENAAAPERAYSWFPGHMRKAMRQLEEQLSLADIVLLVMDARIPSSSRQPDLEAMLRQRGKEFIFVLNKTDLADATETKLWLQKLRRDGYNACTITAISGKGAGPLESAIAAVRQRVQQQRQKKGLLSRDPRLAVVGIPNVGKSSLLNRLAGSVRAKTGARPGITRGNQWVAVSGKWQLLDSPGILYPRIEGEYCLTSLVAAGCVSTNAVPLERVGGLMLRRLISLGKQAELFGDAAADSEADPIALLEQYARRKNFVLSQGEPDLIRAATLLLKMFAQGQFGRLTLEPCPRAARPAELEETEA